MKPQQQLLLDGSHERLAYLQEVIRRNPDNTSLLNTAVVRATVEKNVSNLRQMNDETLIVLAEFAHFALGLALATMEIPPERKPS